jgi:membrane fusion protein, multidrug efflux system
MIDFKPSAPELPKMSRSRANAWTWGASLAVIAIGALAAVTMGQLDRGSAAKPIAAAAAAVAPQGVPVSVAVVEQHDTAIWNEFSGRVEALGRVEIRPRVAGAIMETHFREGALVNKGDLLFTIDPAPYAAEVKRSEAAVSAAIARMVLAAREQQRGKSLVGTSDLPQRDLDSRVNEFNAAQANLDATQAALETSKLNLGWTGVRAPISGRVGKIEVTPGNLVPAGAGAPVLTTLVSVNPIYASFEADEQSVARAVATLPPGTDVVNELGRIPVQMETLTKAGTTLQGKLQLIDNVVDARSGTVRVRAVFDNPDGRLMPGQFARLRLGQAANEPIIAIDEQAIGTDQDRRFVMVVGADNKAVYRGVQLGGVTNNLRIVTGGLQPGERIVVNGLQRIRPGAVVAPQIVAMNTPAGIALTSR